VSSVELEAAVMAGVPDVAEAAAVGVARPGGGPERLVLHVVLRPAAAAGGAAPAELLRACQAAVRQRLNPLFKVDQVRVSPRLGHSHCACRCFYLCAWPTLAHGPTACDVMAVLQTH